MCTNSKPVKINTKVFPSIKAACDFYGKDYGAVMQRVSKLNWNLEEAVTTPFRNSNNKEVILPDGTTFKSIKEFCAALGLNEGTVYQYSCSADYQVGKRHMSKAEV